MSQKKTCFPINYRITDLAVFGWDKALTLTHSFTNLFWKYVGKATIELLKNTASKMCTWSFIITTICNNPNIKIPFRKEGYRNGINMIGDVFNEDLGVWHIKLYKTLRNVECNFIERESIKKRCQKHNVHYEYVKISTNVNYKNNIPCCNMTRSDVKQYVNCHRYILIMSQHRKNCPDLTKDGTIHGKGEKGLGISYGGNWLIYI